MEQSAQLRTRQWVIDIAMRELKRREVEARAASKSQSVEQGPLRHIYLWTAQLPDEPPIHSEDCWCWKEQP